MGKFSSEEIESQYNLIKMLLAEPEKYRDAINAIKKDIALSFNRPLLGKPMVISIFINF